MFDYQDIITESSVVGGEPNQHFKKLLQIITTHVFIEGK